MNIDRRGYFVTGLLVVLATAFAAPRLEAKHPTADVIYEWNLIAQKSIAGPPFSQTRSYAMVHVAMADAVIAIDGRYQAFHVNLKAPPGASAEAAAAQAARDVLTVLAPANQATYDAALAARLAGIPFGQRWLGVQVGKKVAARVLAWRQFDGFASANPQPPPFLASELPGIWRQTATGPAQFAELGSMEPFGLLSAYQFLPPPPPQLESDRYATDYNDVKDNGSSTSTTRSTEQTRFAQLFASSGPYVNGTNPFHLWHNVARDISKADRYSLVQTARLYALLTVSIQDSVQTSHASKFVYRLWRPETAVANAGIDDNAGTEAASGWAPLIGTPPYPSHASNMSCIGAGAARMLANVFGTDNRSFTATWYSTSTPPTVVHAQPYTSFWALGQDEGSSRVWGGIHYRFEIDASEHSCLQIADYLYDNYMQPTSRHR